MRKRAPDAAFLGGLALITALAYLPALCAGFIWDDSMWLTGNLLVRSPSGPRRMFLEPDAGPQYYPLTFLLFWIEHRLWGFEPFGYHATNLALHLACGLTLHRLARRLELPAPALVAGLFLVHPVQVESVAWVSERKNVFSLWLALLSALAWLRYLPPGAGSPRGPRGFLALSIALYVAALLAKTAVVTLPGALAALAWWKRGRLRPRELAALAPFLLAGLALGLLTIELEARHIGDARWAAPLYERAVASSRAAVFYAGKLLWPHPLCFSYPRWSTQGVAQLLWPLGLFASLLALWALRRRLGRGPLAGALCYLALLLPTLGAFEVFAFRYYPVADHWQYHATPAGLALAVATGAALVRRLRLPELVPRALVVALALALATLSHRHARLFRSSELLWEDALTKSPRSTLALNNLAILRMREGRLAEARELLERALAVEEDAEEHVNLGIVEGLEGRLEEARRRFERALELEPESPRAWHNLALAREELGLLQRAADGYERALALDPSKEETARQLAAVCARIERGQLAPGRFARR